MDLIFIHGRDQQGKDPVALKSEWTTALNKGMASAGLSMPDGVNVRMPFYGDILAQLVDQADAGALTERGTPSDKEQIRFYNEVLNELAEAGGISEEEIVLAMNDPLAERGPLNWGWVQGILKALDRTPLGGAAIDRFTHDVFLYLTIPAVRQRINAIVAAELPGDRCVVVAHSLGTVVAYDVLRGAKSPTASPAFITVGSPLGLRAVRKQLTAPLHMPSGSAHWHNAYDERDVVALLPLDFTIAPPQNPLTNYNKVKNHTENRHGISGYLDDPLVAKWIHQALSI